MSSSHKEDVASGLSQDLHIPVPSARVKSAFDWAIKIGGVLYLAFRFYSQQQELRVKVDENHEDFRTILTHQNQIDRDFIEIRSDVKTLERQLQDEREFYRETVRKER